MRLSSATPAIRFETLPDPTKGGKNPLKHHNAIQQNQTKPLLVNPKAIEAEARSPAALAILSSLQTSSNRDPRTGAL